MLAPAIRGAVSPQKMVGSIDLMGSWFRALGLFGLLVSVPFLMERLLGRHAQFPIGGFNVRDSFWHDLASYSGFGVIMFLVIALLLFFAIFLPQTYQISDWLSLAEREMNGFLRGWGGGMPADARRGMAEERGKWLTMIPNADKGELTEVYKQFFTLNQKDLEGGPQGAAMGKARMTAFLLREIYEGDVLSAQRKVFDETKLNDGKIPFVAPGIRELIGLDQFDKEKGFPRGAGVGWFPLMLTVKLNGYPRNIIMVKPGPGGKVAVRNWDVLEELTTPKI